MDTLPTEVLCLVLDYMDINQLIQLTRVCKLWQHVLMEFVIPRYAHRHTKYRRDVLVHNTNITDDGLKVFAHVNELWIEQCKHVHGYGFKYLSCNTLQLYDMDIHTMTYMQNMKNVRLISCRIDDKSLIHLRNAETVYLDHTSVSDAGIAHLCNVKKISLLGCRHVTAAGLRFLTACDVDISHCNHTDASLEALSHVERINIAWNYNITEAGLAHLKNLKWIGLWNCYIKITRDAIQKLRTEGVVVED